MAKIRKLKFYDIFKIKKMISLLQTENFSAYSTIFTPFPLNFIQDLLPFKLKTFAESYVIEDLNEILGVISIQSQKGNPYKWKITKLYLKDNAYEFGSQLLNYVLSKYGAQGVNTFYVKIDDNNADLLDLFTKAANFRNCSSEHISLLDTTKIKNYALDNEFIIRPFKNSDAFGVAEIYNNLIFPHFRTSLAKKSKEFRDDVFKGLSRIYSFKYVIENKNDKKLIGYFRIATEDNYNYCLEMYTYQPYMNLLENIIHFSNCQIQKRKSDFNLYFHNKKYQSTFDIINQKIEHAAQEVTVQTVMVKDYYKRIENKNNETSAAMFFNEIRTISRNLTYNNKQGFINE